MKSCHIDGIATDQDHKRKWISFAKYINVYIAGMFLIEVGVNMTTSRENNT